MNSLNLLPPAQKKSWHQRQTLEHWQQSLWILLVAVLLVNAGAIVGAQWLLHRDQNLQQQTLEQQRRVTGSTGTVSQTIQHINETLTPLQTALGNSPAWAKDLATLTSLFPANIVTLSQLQLTAQGQFEASGTIATRSDYLQLDTAIKASPLLKNVTTDTKADKRENLPFHYLAQWQPPS